MGARSDELFGQSESEHILQTCPDVDLRHISTYSNEANLAATSYLLCARHAHYMLTYSRNNKKSKSLQLWSKIIVDISLLSCPSCILAALKCCHKLNNCKGSLFDEDVINVLTETSHVPLKIAQQAGVSL